MNRHLLFFGLCTILSLSIGTGCATSPKSIAQGEVESPESNADRLFEVLDVNGDGLITPEEARSGFQYIIASYDRPTKTEILAAKPGGRDSKLAKRRAKRQPTSQDANRAFNALFVAEPTKVGNGLTQDEFKTLVVKASDNPETDPFAAFF
jgi:hypothetical protein